ncbi:hypothetical protein YPPY15_1165 [Yersinia pestis PY-15]|nr:hypothetical protein YpAngola_A0177 [Yersinia pestis Angola]ADV97509.1 hypothetical protein YPC_0817 [Yersinia pestis biovar Medievalis str. Harbin 35]EFA46866.1 conserved hypothetical protein [Yersinia pestis KIM D27]EIR50702.1 hypothetical protein YPPY15_1165 [Yersinia pestis PY-15]EIR94535.1 hypothetical protein YPPY42_1215 [Yersinia pestis PY-42]EIS33013.1 hypothetical protein YPPY54_1219 [Yersinia pestis PY-54]EIS47214.1 hypothetical protein YPPY58_1198 [Yersinia pestis PY-58]
MPDSDNVNAHGSAAHVFFTEPVLKNQIFYINISHKNPSDKNE